MNGSGDEGCELVYMFRMKHGELLHDPSSVFSFVTCVNDDDKKKQEMCFILFSGGRGIQHV